jgi:catechol 2,3-dioxygenase-like lactoylglutathione lyase family enzyme
MGPFKADDDWMAVHLGVPARAEIPQMQLVRCGYGTNLELLQYKVEGQSRTMPKNSDLGGYHVAFYVDDMDKAVAYLKTKGLKFLGEPTKMTAGPSAGETWGYFLSPWGMNLELVSYPQGKAYQKEYKTRLWSAKDPGK